MNLRLYSKTTMIISTLILTPLLGCILFSYNLKEIGKGKLSFIFIPIGFFWTVLFKKIIADFIPSSFIQLILSNIAGAFLMNLLWDKFFIQYSEYEPRKPWKLLSIFVGICLLLFFYFTIVNPK